jgi:hypothetical protein
VTQWAINPRPRDSRRLRFRQERSVAFLGGRRQVEAFNRIIRLNMNVQCPHCGRVNNIPSHTGQVQFRCYNCAGIFSVTPAPSADTSEAVGLIGGAVLGGAIAGPIGAVVGAIIGAVLGRENKGTT